MRYYPPIKISAFMLFSSLCLFLFIGCQDKGGDGENNTPTPTLTPTLVVTEIPSPTSTLMPTLTPAPRTNTLKLVFIHHSVGEGLLSTSGGNLRQILNENLFYVTDTNYGWSPSDEGFTIGDNTDIGHWYYWFLGPRRDAYLAALSANTHLTESAGTNSFADPGGENGIVMFKSCYPNGQNLSGNPDDAPLAEGAANPIKGEGSGNPAVYTVANIKGLYRDLLTFFALHQDKLFILVTTPPSSSHTVDAATAARQRGICNWLVDHWLESYPHHNVAVFDYYNVLTPDGHHRYQGGVVQHIHGSSNFSAYSSSPGDDHPNVAGQQKAAGEFITLLNYYIGQWAH